MRARCEVHPSAGGVALNRLNEVTMARIDIAFFPDFKSTDTLLIDGDREGIRLLAGLADFAFIRRSRRSSTVVRRRSRESGMSSYSCWTSSHHRKGPIDGLQTDGSRRGPKFPQTAQPCSDLVPPVSRLVHQPSLRRATARQAERGLSRRSREAAQADLPCTLTGLCDICT